MFLGWVCNALLLAFTQEFTRVPGFKSIFWTLQVLVAGMLISFPLQGYGFFSILFSAIHTVAMYIFIILFFRATRMQRSMAVAWARVSLLFFVLASIGPFALGYLKAMGLEHSNLYRHSIYFYLHFQYNGFFFFGILSLFIHLLEPRFDARSRARLKLAARYFKGACIPAFLLSTLWSGPHGAIYLLGFISAIVQLAAFFLFAQPAMTLFEDVGRYHYRVRLLFGLSLSALFVKLVLQLISSLPTAAAFANEYRDIVVAYLHLVLVGMVTLFLIGWLIHTRVIRTDVPWGLAFLLTGFVCSEVILVISPWMLSLPAAVTVSKSALVILSVLMVAGLGIILRATIPLPASGRLSQK